MVIDERTKNRVKPIALHVPAEYIRKSKNRLVQPNIKKSRKSIDLSPEKKEQESPRIHSTSDIPFNKRNKNVNGGQLSIKKPNHKNNHVSPVKKVKKYQSQLSPNSKANSANPRQNNNNSPVLTSRYRSREVLRRTSPERNITSYREKEVNNISSNDRSITTTKAQSKTVVLNLRQLTC
eukprot:UN30984